MSAQAGTLQIAACWHLGQVPDDAEPYEDDPQRRAAFYNHWIRLHRWAHQLGFGGHFSTKSRRYSTTLGALRNARRQWHHLDKDIPDADESGDEPDILTIGHLAFAGVGWHTSADALLANTAAAHARQRRHTAREELEQPH